MSDGAGTASYTHDALNRLTAVARGEDTFTYAYDSAGNVTERGYPGVGPTTYAYDDDGRLATVTRAAVTARYGYDSAGRIIDVELPASNGHTETRTYDRAGRLTDVRHERAGATLAFAQYAYDAVGNPTTITRDGGSETYTYDALDRLTEVCYATDCPGPSDSFIRYAYDAVGNRASETRPTGSTTYTYDAADQITTREEPAGTVAYTFDANGNQTQAGTRSFVYDLANRLRTTSEGGVTTTYAYDGRGKRLETGTGSSTTHTLWDENAFLPQLALERDGAGVTLRSYLHGHGPLSFTTAGETSYLHHDAIGSVTALTSSTGEAQWRYAYEPFGATRTATEIVTGAPSSPLRFAGEHLDPTNLYHLRARQYDPLNGRFLAIDPLPAPIAEPFTSTYHYARNRPTVLIDPSGMGSVVPDANTCGSLWCWADDRARAITPISTGEAVGGFTIVAGTVLGASAMIHGAGCVAASATAAPYVAVTLAPICAGMAFQGAGVIIGSWIVGKEMIEAS